MESGAIWLAGSTSERGPTLPMPTSRLLLLPVVSVTMTGKSDQSSN